MNKHQKLVPFSEWFDPYNPLHLEWAREYLVNPRFDWEKVVPNTEEWTVYPLGDCYGIREHILRTLATCWILYKLKGVKTKPVTH